MRAKIGGEVKRVVVSIVLVPYNVRAGKENNRGYRSSLIEDPA
jgi:hypothetical protein